MCSPEPGCAETPPGTAAVPNTISTSAIIFSFILPPSLRAADKDIPHGRAHFQHRAAAIQISFRRNHLRAILPAFRGNPDFREIGSDSVASCCFNTRVDSDIDL